MKNIFIIIASLAIAAMSLNSCGGGGGGGSSSSPQVSSQKTTVTINVGQTRSLSSHTKERFVRETSAIPPAVASIRITVTAPDMNPVSQVIDVAGRSSVSLAFQLQNGQNRDFVAEALDASGNVLYRGETFAGLDGTPLHLTIVMVSIDPLPPVFGGLTDITDITETSMRLSWSPGTDEVTPQDQIVYLIFVSTNSQTIQGRGASTPPSFVTDPGATSLALTNLIPDTEYFVKVQAMDQKGNRDNNNVIKNARTKLAPDTKPPTFGGLVSATAKSESEIELKWDAASDDRTDPSQIDYLIYMSVTSGFTPGEGAFATPKAVVTGSTLTTIAGLDSNTTYFFIVRARDKAGNVDSNRIEKSATTSKPEDKTPPTFPNGLGLSVQATSPTQVLVIWNAASDDPNDPSTLTYIIYKSSTPEGVYSSPFVTLLPGQWKTSSSKLSNLLRTKASTISYTVDNLTPDTQNCFGVNAQDQAGNPTTNTETTCVHTPPTPDTTSPSVPTGLTATPASTSQINLSWTASSDNVGVVGYKVYRKDKLPGPIQSVSGTSASDTGLSPSTEYCYSVSAVDAVPNESAKSTEVCAKTKTPDDTIPPSAPTGLTATAISSSQINLSWNASTDNVGVIGYKVYRNGQVVASSKKSAAIAIAAITTTNYSDTAGLTPNTQFCYQVSAYDAANNESAKSNQACATTPSAPICSDKTPPTFAGLVSASVASLSDGLTFTLTWNPATDNVTAPKDIVYLVYMATTSGGQDFRAPIVTTPAGFTSTTFIAGNFNTTYFFVVRAMDLCGNIDGNTVQRSVTTPSQFTDLFISRIWDSCGDGCDAFDVRNSGPLGATGVNIYAINGYLGIPTTCQGFFDVAVPAFSFVTLGTFIDVLSGFNDYYIIIDPDNTILESNKTNNTACGGLFCSSPPVWPTDFGICF